MHVCVYNLRLGKCAFQMPLKVFAGAQQPHTAKPVCFHTGDVHGPITLGECRVKEPAAVSEVG